MNSARAAAFHLSDILSTLLPVDAVLEIRRTSAPRERRAEQSATGLDLSPQFLNRSTPLPLPRTQFGGKCPLFQSIYYCF